MYVIWKNLHNKAGFVVESHIQKKWRVMEREQEFFLIVENNIFVCIWREEAHNVKLVWSVRDKKWKLTNNWPQQLNGRNQIIESNKRT